MEVRLGNLKTGKRLKGQVFLRAFAQWLYPICSLTGQLVKVLSELPMSLTNALGTWPEANSFLSPVQCVTLPEPFVTHEQAHKSHNPQQPMSVNWYSSVVIWD